MAYPPSTWGDFEDTGGLWGPMEEERMPISEAFITEDFIHFDLDPYNGMRLFTFGQVDWTFGTFDSPTNFSSLCGRFLCWLESH